MNLPTLLESREVLLLNKRKKIKNLLHEYRAMAGGDKQAFLRTSIEEMFNNDALKMAAKLDVIDRELDAVRSAIKAERWQG